jgi:hypothetical protein
MERSKQGNKLSVRYNRAYAWVVISPRSGAALSVPLVAVRNVWMQLRPAGPNDGLRSLSRLNYYISS